MNTAIIDRCLVGTFEGTVAFPEVVERLSTEGVEWYSANLLSATSTHYSSDGDSHSSEWPEDDRTEVSASFVAGAVESAIRASQRGEIKYPEFLRRIAKAGVVYYTVHLQGRKALYFGRHGEFHLEPFPSK